MRQKNQGSFARRKNPSSEQNFPRFSRRFFEKTSVLSSEQQNSTERRHHQKSRAFDEKKSTRVLLPRKISKYTRQTMIECRVLERREREEGRNSFSPCQCVPLIGRFSQRCEWKEKDKEQSHHDQSNVLDQSIFPVIHGLVIVFR